MAILFSLVLFSAKSPVLLISSIWLSGFFLSLTLFAFGLEFLAWAQLIVATSASMVFTLQLILNREQKNDENKVEKHRRYLLLGTSVLVVSALLGLFKIVLIPVRSSPNYRLGLRDLGYSLTSDSLLIGVIVLLIGTFLSLIGSLIISRTESERGLDEN